jgi:ankyrin repeat protein
LHLAFRYKRPNIVKEFIKSGRADLNEKDNYGLAPIHYATTKRWNEIVKDLLRNGANVNEKDKYGFTSLQFASRIGYPEIVKELLQSGADYTELNNERKIESRFLPEISEILEDWFSVDVKEPSVE